MSLIKWLGQKTAACRRAVTTKVKRKKDQKTTQEVLNAPRAGNQQDPWRYGQKVKRKPS